MLNLSLLRIRLYEHINALKENNYEKGCFCFCNGLMHNVSGSE